MTNIERIREKLSEHDIDAMLITSPAGRLFATGFSSTAGALIVCSDNAWFTVDSRYIEAAGAVIKEAQIVPQDKGERFDDCIKSLILKNNISKLGFEDGEMTYSTYLKLNAILDAQMVPSQKLLNVLRNVKSRAELDNMIKAQRLAEIVFYEILPIISTDITEKDLAAEIIYRIMRKGAEKESFKPIVVSGNNSSRPHGEPGDNKLNKGFLTIDFGVCLNGWCSDTTRTLCIGKPDEEMAKVYETVLKAQEAGISTVHEGVKGADVDAAARYVIEKAGYGDFFGHGFGHSLGLEVHETLSASPLSEDILPAGAIISAEPGIYLPGRFGVRIEDVLYITKDGCENITRLPKELTVL